MRLIRNVIFSLTLVQIGCALPPMNVEIGVLPPVPASAKIKQLEGPTSGPEQSVCRVPCSVRVGPDSKYEVRVEAAGYYPAVVQFDNTMAFHTAVALGNAEQTRLVIPLVEKTHADGQ